MNGRQHAATQRLRVQRLRARFRSSAGRYRLRRYAAGLIAAPVGLLSGVARVFGRRPQWGRRFYRWLAGRASTDRMARDAAIAQAELDDQNLPDPAETVNRPRAAIRGASGSTYNDTEFSTMGFDFRQATEDIVEQASGTQLDGMMAVRTAIHGMPEAVANFAKAFGIVAEAVSPANAPLHGAVSDALTDTYKALLAAVIYAERVGDIFENRHADDIARHIPETARVGEHHWDTTMNQD